MERFLAGYWEYLYALMRIFVGLLFSCNGARKLFGVFGGLDGAGAAAVSCVESTVQGQVYYHSRYLSLIRSVFLRCRPQRISIT